MPVARIVHPKPPRKFPGWRLAAVIVRSVHVIAVGVVLGGTVFSVPNEALMPWWHAAGVSGLVLLGLDLFQSLVLFQLLHVWVTLAKIAALGLLFHLGGLGFWTLAAIAAVSAFFSHAPRTIRHYAPLKRVVIEIGN